MVSLPYNLTYVDEAIGYPDLFVGANITTTGGILGILILIIVAIIQYAAYSKINNKSSMVAITFFLSLLSTLMWAAQILSLEYAAALVVVFLGVTLFKIVTVE